MKKTIIILYILLYCVTLNGQQLKVLSDKNPAIIGEQILIQYSIDEKGNNFISPNFNGLRVLSGPNPSTQSSYTIINGKSESTISTTYSFYLQANKEGNYTISPAKITVNNKQIISKAYELKIVKGAANTKNQDLSKSLFINVDVTKKNIFVGEQILVTYKLYTRIDLQNTEIYSLPNLNGFWNKDLQTSSRFKREVIDGIAYNTAIVKKSVLTAQQSGKLIIDPIEIKCGIRVQSKRNRNDPFANFFGNGYQVREEVIRSKKIKINVNELPASPEFFDGAVGNMEVKSEVDHNTINANEAITYKLTINGTGNIELIKPPNITFPEDFEVYDPKTIEKIFEGGRKRSVKTFEYLLIPRYEGEYTIPSLEFVFFDPKKSIYKTKKSNNHKLTINKPINSEEEERFIKKNVEEKKKDINYIFTESNLTSTERINHKLFLGLFFLPFLLLIIIYIYTKYISIGNTNKTKHANKVALKRLLSAKNCIKNDNYELFFEEIEKSLWGYFSDKFKVPLSKLSKENIIIYFENYNIKNKTQENFIQLIGSCELARYAPSNNKNNKMEKILNEAKEIIIKMEIETK